MTNQWRYLGNQFVSSTRNNYKKALKLSNYHDAKLKATKDANPGDPDWAVLYNRYHPMHTDLVAKYNAWKTAGGIQEGQTLNTDQLLILLVTKINTWDVAVQVKYAKGTPEYKTIFPDGHYAFIGGSKDTKIMAVQTLGSLLAGYAPMAAVKAEVDAFYTTLDLARDVQEGAKGSTKTGSGELAGSVRKGMVMQYGNLGFLINKYMDDPQQVAPFFELSILREHEQVVYTGVLDAGENEAVLIHTFVADDELRIKITGAGEASFYLATAANGVNSTAVKVNETEHKTIAASAFGISDYGSHRYLTAVNNGAVPLDYEIHLL
jgi:hypothetical protein